MKKTVAVILMLTLLVTMAALTGCNKEPADGDGAVNVKNYDDLDSLNKQTDVNLNLPANAEKAQFNLVDGTIAQSDYYVEDIHYIVRVTKGAQDNLSGISADEKFTNDETADICGLSTRLRYNISETGSDSDTSYGIADAYDAETDISYCVFMIKGGTKDLLTTAMEKLITGETEVTTE